MQHCRYCGDPLPDGATICPSCKTPVVREAGISLKDTDTDTERLGPNRMKYLWIGVACAVVLLAVAGYFLYQRYLATEREEGYEACLQEARRDLDDGRYARAIDGFQEALDLLPDGEEALDGLETATEALQQEGLDQAEALLRGEDFAGAAQALRKVEPDAASPAHARWESLRTLSTLDPKILYVDASAFPNVLVILTCGDPDALSGCDLTLLEDGEERSIQASRTASDAVELHFLGADAEGGPQQRLLTLQIERDGFQFTREASYETPARSPAPEPERPEEPITGPAEEEEVLPSEPEEPVYRSSYTLVKEAVTWAEAVERCEEMGGHLATITSREEEQKIIDLAEAQGVRYIWLGGYTSADESGNVRGHWITGEDFSAYQHWSSEEPSGKDLDGTAEDCIMLWNIERLGGWCWNDQRNDPVSVMASMGKDMGFVCEYETLA